MPPPPAFTRGDRPYQQDQVLMHEPPAHLPGCVLGVVADGMGGRSGGRKASDQVLMTARQLFARYKPGQRRARPVAAAAAGRCPHGDQAHRAVGRAGAAQHAGGVPHESAKANAPGSMPAIRASTTSSKGRLVKRTQRPLLRAGAGRPRRNQRGREAKIHPQANILLGCLGMAVGSAADRHPPVTPRWSPATLLMACSDGLWHYFTPEEMGALLAETIAARRRSNCWSTKRARARAARATTSRWRC